MFLRKLIAALGPLLLCLGLVLLLPLVQKISGDWFLQFFLSGLLIGAALAALVPLIGARRREPFLPLLWVSVVILILVIGYQALFHAHAINLAALEFLAASSDLVVLVESAFLGFMLTLVLRGIK